MADIEYVTPDQMEELTALDPDAYLFATNLALAKIYKIQAKNLLLDLSEIPVNLDGGSFL